MNKKYLKLGVLLVGLLAFFGGTNVVSAGDENCDNKNSAHDPVKSKYGYETCTLYGDKGKMTITVRDCDQGQGGRIAKIKVTYDGNNTYLAFADDNGGVEKNGSIGIKNIGSYKTLLSEKGCPSSVVLNPDGWWADDHRADFYFGTSGSAAGGAQITGDDIHTVFAFRNAYYDDIKTNANNYNKEIENKLTSFKNALAVDYTVGEVNKDFFNTNPTTSKLTMPKYSGSSTKYVEGYVKGLKSADLLKLYYEVQKDSNTIASLSSTVANATTYSNELTTAIDNLVSYCKTKGILETESNKSLGVGKFDPAGTLNTADKIKQKISQIASGTPDDKKNLVAETANACYDYGKWSVKNDDKNTLQNYVDKLNIVQSENTALKNVILWIKERAAELKMDLPGLENTINKIENNEASLTKSFEELVANVSSIGDESFDFGQKDPANCTSLLGEEAMIYLNNAYFMVEIVVVVLVVLLSMVDFSKSAASGDADMMKKTWKRLTTRIILVMAVVIMPVLVGFVIDIFNIKGIDPDHPICIIEENTNSANPSADNEEV